MLLEDETGSGREGPTSVSFTEWEGLPAVRLKLVRTHETSDGGTTERRERLLIVRKDLIEVVADRQLAID